MGTGTQAALVDSSAKVMPLLDAMDLAVPPEVVPNLPEEVAVVARSPEPSAMSNEITIALGHLVQARAISGSGITLPFGPGPFSGLPFSSLQDLVIRGVVDISEGDLVGVKVSHRPSAIDWEAKQTLGGRCR